jgi:hypothetical protein
MEIKLGPHLVEIEADCMTVRHMSDFTLEHMKEWCRIADQVIAEHGHILTITDFRHGGDFPSESRRYASEWPNVVKVWGSAMFGGSYAQRVLINMIASTTRWLRKYSTPIASFKTEAEARAWIADIRTQNINNPMGK